jgi:hypothetical protein
MSLQTGNPVAGAWTNYVRNVSRLFALIGNVNWKHER